MSSWFLITLYITGDSSMSNVYLIYKIEVVNNLIIGMYSQDRNTNVNILYTDSLPYPLGQPPSNSELTGNNFFNVSTLEGTYSGFIFRDEYLQNAISNSTPFFNFYQSDVDSVLRFWVYRINLSGSNTDNTGPLGGRSVDITISATTANETTTQIPCFKENTKILTIKGYIPIQELRKGDLVKTLKHEYKPIVMIGKSTMYHSVLNERIKDQLYKCSPSKYPQLNEDLIITGCHSLLVNRFISEEQRETVIQVNGDTYTTDYMYRLPACADHRASIYETCGTYTIYHLALENENYYRNYGIYANGLLVESCSKRYLKECSMMTLID